MPPLCGPSGLWRHWSARPTRSPRRAGRGESWAWLRAPIAPGTRRRIRRMAGRCVWCSPVWVRHYAGPFGRHLLAATPVEPVEILVAARTHVSKGTWGETGVTSSSSAWHQHRYRRCRRYWQGMRAKPVEAECPSTSSGHMNDELSPHVLRFLPRQQTERLPRCPFAPRRLHRVLRPHCASPANPSRVANALNDVVV
jgi:hypothetical protein